MYRRLLRNAHIIEEHLTIKNLLVEWATEFYSYSTKVADPSAKNWTWNICYIDGVKVTDLDYSNAQKTGLVAHELGHAMGLSHQPTRKSDSIMYNYDSRCFADGSARNRPAKRDCNNINHIY